MPTRHKEILRNPLLWLLVFVPVVFAAARKNRLDLSVGIALGSASQIALFVARVLVLLSYVLGPTPMDLRRSGTARPACSIRVVDFGNIDASRCTKRTGWKHCSTIQRS